MPTAATPVTARSVLDELKRLGRDPYKRILLNHGIREPVYGVKIEDLKTIQKRVKTDHRLALELFDTGVYDAMYLGGLIADDAKMTKADLRRWVSRAGSPALCCSIVAWVAAGSNHGWALGLEWIDAKDESVAATGWATLSGIVALTDDAELDLPAVRRLLKRVAGTIHEQPDDVRYVMNGFVIAVGSYVKPLSDEAVVAAKSIGKVSVDVGDTACKVPDATAYIDKVKRRGAIGEKRKTVKC